MEVHGVSKITQKLIHKLKVGSDQVPLNKIAFWIKIHKLPCGTFTVAVGKSLGNYIGKFLEYETTNRGFPWMKSMRIRVELDVDKPLRKGRKNNVGGTSVEVVFKYERLHIFCYICGNLGHTNQFCEIRFVSPDGNVLGN